MERARLREELLEVLRHLERQLGWQEASCSPGMTRRGRASKERAGGPSGNAQGSPAQRLEALSARIGDCTRCPLHRDRTKIVFGSGNPEARIMFIGEAPGYEEDRQGVPFVGRSGRLLRRMLGALSFPLDEIYIANIVKCRPPGNRDPEEGEIAACLPFLERQIEIVAPAVLCTLGRIAAQTLLSTRKPMGRMRGKFFDYKGIPLMATFHPSYLLRNPGDKRLVMEDLKLLLERAEEAR